MLATHDTLRQDIAAALDTGDAASLHRALRQAAAHNGQGAYQLIKSCTLCADEITKGLQGLLSARRPAEAAELIGALSEHVPVLRRVEPVLLGQTVALLPQFPQPRVAERCDGLAGLIAGVAQAAAQTGGEDFLADFADGYRRLDKRLRAQVVRQAVTRNATKAVALLGRLAR